MAEKDATEKILEAYNEDTYNNAEKGAPENMCEVLDRIESRGIARGVAIGEEKKIRETAKKLCTMGLSVDNIALAVGLRLTL